MFRLVHRNGTVIVECDKCNVFMEAILAVLENIPVYKRANYFVYELDTVTGVWTKQ